MAVGFEALLWSLTMQESGGNYGAVGVWVKGDRAYGRYQVMGANVGPWTQKYYGKRLTPQQFLANRAAQDAVVRGVLYGYYKKYGAAGAAAMWYSGQPNPNKTYGNPPVKSYVNSVLSRAGGYRGQTTASGSGGGFAGGAAGTGAKLDKDELAESYGLSSALINSSKELKSLFSKAVAGNWSAAKFQASLKNSRWWKTQSSTLRKYITMRFTDPATFKQNQSAAWAKYNQMAVAVGTGNQMKNGKPTAWLKAIAYKGLALGWSDARIKAWIGQYVHLQSGGIMYGEAGEAFDKLHELAYLNGMKYSASWYEREVKKIMSGKSTAETLEAYIRKQAATKYSAYAEQIKAGQNVLDLAAPYIKTVSTLLELPETDVDLTNKYVHNAMSGGHAGENFPLWQLENAIRKDPLWKKTNNARESLMGVAHQVARDFGVAF